MLQWLNKALAPLLQEPPLLVLPLLVLPLLELLPLELPLQTRLLLEPLPSPPQVVQVVLRVASSPLSLGAREGRSSFARVSLPAVERCGSDLTLSSERMD
jgi:hypothetical protein